MSSKNPLNSSLFGKGLFTFFIRHFLLQIKRKRGTIYSKKKIWNGGKKKWREAKLIATELTVAKLIASVIVDHQWLQIAILCFFINEILRRVSTTTAWESFHFVRYSLLDGLEKSFRWILYHYILYILWTIIYGQYNIWSILYHITLWTIAYGIIFSMRSRFLYDHMIFKFSDSLIWILTHWHLIQQWILKLKY